MCGRGLKHTLIDVEQPLYKVARRVRAWIETEPVIVQHIDDWSPAVCGRGLKQCILDKLLLKFSVARRVRAWIETCSRADIGAGRQRRPPCAGVD